MFSNLLFKKLAKALLYLFLLAFLSYGLISVYIASQVYIDNKTQSDVIIVLGAKSFIDGEVNQCVKARVHHAVKLYNDGLAHKIIMSGGTDKKPIFHDTDEAQEMKKIALSIDPNIDENDILLEGESTSTYENLLFSQNIMQRNDLTSAIIVTEPFHSPRANMVASKLGIAHTVSPTLTSPCWNERKYLSRYFLREPIVLIGYKILNQI